MFNKVIKTQDELSGFFGEPSDLVKSKVIDYLDHHCLDFISRSPFLVISTSDNYGKCDVSPRGDHPGFIKIIDEKRFLIPERPGNKRMDSLYNIISNPHAGLLFVIPGLQETLRINGKASLIQDEDLLEEMAVNGRKPLIAIAIEVEECFIHCAKAFKRSGLWQPSTWPPAESLPSAAKILSAHAKTTNLTVEEVEERLKESYSQRLY
ncbi:pyridoxamine 5'-phosphate oxidase family protein [Cytobacillus suaedae]|nr:pyridoxamine 5'-phosphate oxidase family protein [Cytobacillus suaedae]